MLDKQKLTEIRNLLIFYRDTVLAFRVLKMSLGRTPENSSDIPYKELIEDIQQKIDQIDKEL